jgi:type 1 glutamine amidotransferase
MRSDAAALLLLLVAALATPAIQAAGDDCPLARAPYSSTTPFADLQLEPAAQAVLDQLAPGLAGSMAAAHGDAALPPGFAAILSPRVLLQGQPDATARIAALDAALARVPVTRAATLRRCARYDHVPPRIPSHLKHPALLVFDKVNGFRDDASVDAATHALEELAARRGWTLVFSDNGAVFNARDLARFDAVVWNNVSGDALTLPQERAFRRWIEQGGGYAGIHGSAGDPLYIWDWYADTLVGARFIGHPMDPQFQEAAVVVDDPANPIVAVLSPGWRMTEEWYSFAASPRLTGAHVLARLDEATYSPIGFGHADIRMGDHPIAWTRCVGDGRSFYTAIGHRPENYAEPHALALLENGIAWAAGVGDTRCQRNRETPSH